MRRCPPIPSPSTDGRCVATYEYIVHTPTAVHVTAAPLLPSTSPPQVSRLFELPLSELGLRRRWQERDVGWHGTRIRDFSFEIDERASLWGLSQDHTRRTPTPRTFHAVYC